MTGLLRLLTALAVAGTLFAAASSAMAHGSVNQGPSDAGGMANACGVSPPTNPAGSTTATACTEDARITSARSSIAHARPGDAEQTLRSVLEGSETTATTDKTARLLLGKLMLDAQRSDEALDVLMPLDATDEYDAQALLGLAYAAQGNTLAARGAHAEDIAFHHELALASLERAIEMAPPGEVAAAVGALELTLYAMHDPDGALALADRALDKAPTEGEVLLLRGCAGVHAFWNASTTGDTERADVLWVRATDDLRAAQSELAAERVEPWVQLTWLELQKDDTLPQALRDAREAAERGAPGCLFDVAVVGASRGENGPAADALLDLVQRRPRTLTDLLVARPDTASLSERFSQAVFQSDRTYDEAREIHAALAAATRESAAVWNNYALLCRDTGVFDEAYRAYNTALEINGPDARLLNDTALVLHYHLMGDDPELEKTARTLYQRAIKLADEGLACDDLDGDARAELELALTDARNNLRLMDEGKHPNG